MLLAVAGITRQDTTRPVNPQSSWTGQEVLDRLATALHPVTTGRIARWETDLRTRTGWTGEHRSIDAARAWATEHLADYTDGNPEVINASVVYANMPIFAS